jgi:hypothetical protein
MKQPLAWFLVGSVSLAVGIASVGCGGDDSSTGSGGSGGSGGTSTGTAGTGGGSAGKGGSAGTGGSSGTGGSGGTAGTAGTGGGNDSGTDSGGVTIICGSKICSEVDLGLGTPSPPCCAMGEMNACGVSVQGVICLTTTPGTSDPRCPDVTIPMAGTAPGCCTVLGVCGADVGAPLGCNDLSSIGASTPTPCGPDAGPPPIPPEAGSDVTPPPPDSGPGMDSGGSDTGGNDSGNGDAPSSDGGRSDGGATDASGDRAG